MLPYCNPVRSPLSLVKNVGHLGFDDGGWQRHRQCARLRPQRVRGSWGGPCYGPCRRPCSGHRRKRVVRLATVGWFPATLVRLFLKINN